MRNALALIELGQPGVNLREEDQTLYRVIHGRVGRQVLQGLKDAIALRWRSHRPILTLTSAPGRSAPHARRLRRAEHWLSSEPSPPGDPRLVSFNALCDGVARQEAILRPVSVAAKLGGPERQALPRCPDC